MLAPQPPGPHSVLRLEPGWECMDRLVAWQPYHFEDVPSYDRVEAHALDQIARFAPGIEAAQAFRASFSKVLHELRSEEEPGAQAEERHTFATLPERITLRSTGLASRDGVDVIGMDAAAVSYPAFERDLGGMLRT